MCITSSKLYNLQTNYNPNINNGCPVTDIEELDSKRKRSAIIIKEIPYQTNKSAMMAKIAELVENKVQVL
ncbi:hypothetical protein K1719_045753 [Acacia pycnantha]|nr:hypothetical protein K1719_045753 [Acacia pycnantha]